MKVRSVAKKDARIDESKIANEKRALEVSDKDYEDLTKLVKSVTLATDEAPSTETKSLPVDIGRGGLFWGKGTILPPILEEHKRIIRGMFKDINDNDIKGYNVTLYPPSIIKENTTVNKTENDIMCRVISVLGSTEQLIAETSYGKMDATCDIFMSKNQAVMLPYGVCNTVSFGYNNNKNYVFKTLKSTRGISRTKFPDKRWIIIIDFISDESILTRELRAAVKSAKEGKKETTVAEDLVIQKAKNLASSKEVNEIPKVPVQEE